MDLRLDADFLTHPKTVKLVRLVGADGIIFLQRLWEHAARYFPETGEFSDYDAKEMLQAMLLAYYKHKPKHEHLEALVACGFVDLSENRYKLHDWGHHQPYISGKKKRVERATKAAKSRWDTKLASNLDANSIKNDDAPFLTIPIHPKEEEAPQPETDDQKVKRLIDSFNAYVDANVEKLKAIWSTNYAHIGGVDQLKDCTREIREAITLNPNKENWERRALEKSWGDLIRTWNKNKVRSGEVR